MGWIDSQLASQIAKARERAEGFDLEGLAARGADASVSDLASPKALEDKRIFLGLTETATAAARMFERVLAGNELQQVNYLERGASVARAICRIAMRDDYNRPQGFGTGFLVAPGLLLTNNHVLPHDSWAGRSFAEFDFALDTSDRPLPVQLFELEPSRFFLTDVPLDFTLVAVKPRAQQGADLAAFGHLPLIAQVGKVVEGEWLTIIQHPNGELKKLCVRENRFLKRTDDVLWYSTDTMGGSSGSPVFNNDWQVVALHHSGVPETNSAGAILTTRGTIFDPGIDGETDIKWVANEGIRVSRIVATLKERAGDHPLLQPLFAAQPQSSLRSVTITPDPPRREAAAPSTQTLLLTLESGADGQLRVLGGAAAPGTAGAQPAASVSGPAPAPMAGEPVEDASFDAPFDLDYATRRGFDPSFLDRKVRVHLPALGANAAAVAPLLADPERSELRYKGYSVEMHAKRRLAFYSAANIDFAGRFAMRRPADVWRTDPRIALEHQLGEFYYRANQFDRGHITRREDMEYGKTRLVALQTAADTMHFTNCAPQHARFNQSRDTWQGLERHLLEDSIDREDFRAIVITGPVLSPSDPVWERYPNIQYPLRYWKVAAALTASGKLFATAFLLDQTEAIRRFGIEATEVPFGAFKTFQLKISEIERLTGLAFTATVDSTKQSLSAFDPLASGGQEMARVRAGAQEAFATAESAEGGWIPLLRAGSVIGPQDL